MSATEPERGGRRRAIVVAAVAVACAAVLALLAIGLTKGETPDQASVFFPEAERTAAAPLRLPLLDDEPTLGKAGEDVDLARFVGRPVLLNFWASWCVPCRDEAPILNRIAVDEASRGLQVLGVNVEDPSEAARKFVRDYQLAFPSLRTGSRRSVGGYGQRVPESYVIDARGRLAARIIGPVNGRALGELLDRAIGDVTAASG